jgi:hypothetical protein
MDASSSHMSIVPSDKDLSLSDHGDDEDDSPFAHAKEELEQLVLKENRAVLRWRKIGTALPILTAAFVTAETFTTVRGDNDKTFAATVR